MENIEQSSSRTAKLKWTLYLLGAVLLISTIVLFGFVPAIPQNPAYHRFAPGMLPGSNIPNTWNVLTNIPFSIVGLYGVQYCLKSPQPFAPWSWPVFFVGIALTSLGSAFYHWNPVDSTLVWDRLPMTIAFTALFAALSSEQIDPKLDQYLLVPLLLLGVSSVLYWQWTNDLRFYGLIQFFPLIALPVLILAVPERYDSGHYLFYALAFYVLAKIFEACDRETWNLLGVGGHAIKHLLAAGSPISLLIMLKKRRLIVLK